MKFKYSTMSPAYDILDFLPLVILNLCLCCFSCVLTILPDFEPNDYLFETHKNKGKERWEIFAWAIRDIIQKNGEFGICEMSMREKDDYYKFMNGYYDKLNYQLLDEENSTPLNAQKVVVVNELNDQTNTISKNNLNQISPV